MLIISNVKISSIDLTTLLSQLNALRSSLNDLEAQFSEERLRQRITDIANRSIKVKDVAEFDLVLRS
jgi:cell division protein FtsL